MTIEELEQIAESTRAEYAKYDHQINVCMGTGCLSQHSDQLRDALAQSVAAQGKNAFVRRTGCMGLCAAGPLVLIDPEEVLYQHCNAGHTEAIGVYTKESTDAQNADVKAYASATLPTLQKHLDAAKDLAKAPSKN